MTKTIKSQTKIDGYYFITVDDQTASAVDCTCPDHYYRGRLCKHMTSFNREVRRALAFNHLMRQYDVRSQAQRDARATQRIAYELGIGA